MFKLYFLLFYEFTKIGFFAIGGGYTAIPFLFYLQGKYNWFTIDELTNMIAISNITPGPVGINMATYTGYKTLGFTGALIATLSIILIPFLLTILISKLFSKLQNNDSVKNIFIGLRSAACALLTYIAIKLLIEVSSFENFHNFDKVSLILFVILIIPLSFIRKNPLLTIFLGALGGILINGLT